MKNSPYINDDEEIYCTSLEEQNFALNVRKLIDFQNGSRFNEIFSRGLQFEVGLHLHGDAVAIWDDRVPTRFFEDIKSAGVSNLFAIPTGYPYAIDNNSAMEKTEFSPPLIAKIPSSFDQFRKIRGGAVGLYTGLHFLISPCLTYFMLDFNGSHSLIMGPRAFVEDVLNMNIENSWEDLKKEGEVESHWLTRLEDAMIAYGYR